MLTEHDASYIAGISGNAERQKVKNALSRFNDWLVEHGRNEPLNSDLVDYAAYLNGKDISEKTKKETMSRIAKRYGILTKKGSQQISMTLDNTTQATATAKEEDTTAEKKKQVSVYLRAKTYEGLRVAANYLNKSIGEILSEYGDKFVADNQAAIAELLKPNVQLKF